MQSPFSLTKEQCLRFHKDGYVGPLTLCPPEEMLAFSSRVEREVLPIPGPWAKHPEQMRHLDQPFIHEFVTRPELVDPVASLFGPDLVVWRSNFFFKKPGGKEVPWHQDAFYWEIDPPLNVTAWIALDHVDAENACMQLIPGTQKKTVQHIPSTEGMHFENMAEPKEVPVERAVNMVLKPGEYFLFSERLLHHSDPNRSRRDRKNLILRITLPFVQIPPLFDGYKATLISGEDRFGLNIYSETPAALAGAKA